MMLFSKKLDPELDPGLPWCLFLASGLRAVTFKQGWWGKKHERKGEAMFHTCLWCSLHPRKEKERWSEIPVQPVLCPIWPNASNSPSSNPSRTSHPLWLQQIHVPNVCFQLQKMTDPPNPTQMSASEGSKQPCKCTISYNIVQYFSFLAVVVMWFRLAGCLWRSAFILHTHFSLISGDIWSSMIKKSLGSLQGLICPIMGQILQIHSTGVKLFALKKG